MEPIADFLTAAVAWTARNSLSAAVLTGIVLLVTRLLGGRLHPRLATWLWMAVGVRLVLPVAPESAFSLARLLPASPPPAPASTEWPGQWEVVASVDPFQVPAGDLAATATPAEPVSWLALLGSVWGAVAVGLLGMAIWRQWVISRRLSVSPRWTEPSVGALLSDCARETGIAPGFQVVAGPVGGGVAVFGGWRVTHLIIPADFPDRYSAAEQRGILLHELAHIRRHDLLWNWVTHVIQCLHWFNPLIWIAGRRFLALRETLCDRDAVQRLAASDRRSYGTALLKAFEQGRRAATPLPAFAPFFSQTSELKHRLTMILKPQSTPLSIQLTVAALAAATGLATFTAAPSLADEERSERGRERETAREGEREREESPERSREGERESAREGERERETPRSSREGEREREGDSPERGRERSERESARDGEGERGRSREREDGDREGAPAMREGAVGIAIQRDGVSINGGRPVPLVNLRRELEAVNAKSAVLQAAQGVPFQTVETVMTALKSSGIQEISFGTAAAARGEEGGAAREGLRDGEGGRATGPRDGEGAPKTGPRDGEGAPKTGPRDGEGAPKSGPRDGEGDRPSGPRDGEVRREGARDGDAPREGERERPREGSESRRDGDR